MILARISIPIINRSLLSTALVGEAFAKIGFDLFGQFVSPFPHHLTQFPYSHNLGICVLFAIALAIRRRPFLKSEIRLRQVFLGCILVHLHRAAWL